MASGGVVRQVKFAHVMKDRSRSSIAGVLPGAFGDGAEAIPAVAPHKAGATGAAAFSARLDNCDRDPYSTRFLELRPFRRSVPILVRREAVGYAWSHSSLGRQLNRTCCRVACLSSRSSCGKWIDGLSSRPAALETRLAWPSTPRSPRPSRQRLNCSTVGGCKCESGVASGRSSEPLPPGYY